MQVNPLASSNPPTTATNAAASAASLNYNSFLRLLIAQMKNQDPTAPNDPTQQLAQLAAFSNVEQAIQTNSKLDAILTSSALSQADGLIGHTITSADGETTGVVKSITLTSGGAVAILENDSRVPIVNGVVIS